MRLSAVVLGAAALAGAACSSTDPEPPRLARIVISGSVASVVIGAPPLQLTAQGRDQNDQPFAAAITWSSSSIATATVSPGGLVTFLTVGAVTIRAESGTISAMVSITVQPPPPAPAVVAPALDDVTNHGNASDFEVAFDRVDETRISGYRIIMVKSAQAASFQLTQANALLAPRYHAVARGAGPVRVTLAPGVLDSDGDAIVEGTHYTAFVLSVADGVNALDNALSAASNAVRARQATIRITFIADQGVAVSDGASTVLIDALPQTSTVQVNGQTVNWYPAAAGLLSAIQNATPPWNDITLSLITHDHPDHWFATSAAGFLTSHAVTPLVVPPQVAGQLAAHPRLISLSPALFTESETTLRGIRVRALRMVHFNNFGVDFSAVQNLAYLVEIGGKKVLHLGDADFSSQNFMPFNLAAEGIDVVIVPAATVKVTAPNIALVRTLIAPGGILAAHLETSMTAAGVRAIWGHDVDVFTQSLQFVRY